MRTLPVILLFATPALAQSRLYGVASGTLVSIDKATGAATAIGSGIGLGAGNAAAADPQGRIFTDGGPDQLVLVDQNTGLGSVFLTLTGRPIGYGIRGMAFTPAGELYVVLSQASTSTIDRLARIDMATGAYTDIGPTGRSDLQGLACSPSGTLYAIGVNLGGGLYTLNPATGAATLAGATGGFAGDDQALEFDPDGTLYAARNGLRTVNPATGATTLIGPLGGTWDLRGLAIVPATAPCYANCDGSTAAPILNVNDFICFQSAYAAGASYANCDGSTAPPVLNVNDFICFQSAYAAGCP